MSEPLQEFHDTFYFKNGPCCAGCDHWVGLGSAIGECRLSKIIPGDERMKMLGWSWTSYPVPPGHAMTRPDYHCSNFKDDFDWSSLPLTYRARIGELNSAAPDTRREEG